MPWLYNLENGARFGWFHRGHGRRPPADKVNWERQVMARHVDALTAATLKNLREQWWDAAVLGVPAGDAAAASGHAHPRRRMWRRHGRADPRPLAGLAAAIVCDRPQRGARDPDGGGGPIAQLPPRRRPRPTSRALPFTTGAFDAIFCVAVLQHVNDVGRAVARARARDAPGRTRADGRARQQRALLVQLVVAAADAFAAASRFFAAVGRRARRRDRSRRRPAALRDLR